ncbi:LysR family transcriptional regulator [Rhodoblastus sphagnicola]|uniref:LysR family transcriptional regulator n=1 Tax=Rhodoblastus sphagnicola TaxID=333368 RepID=A0A2S6N030_9HYPH|nr:LysR family transcriptional regulator [Rhodoblastus sphagnicola]MBB4197890.1 putative thioesterase [Rhodoblastus sphagnicola]PPQ27960.1 LysR family transcriptional regulator [Rhodoblastus sphagnicola]
MKNTIVVGQSATRRIEIDTPRTIDFLGEALRVYATPELARDFEIVCRDFLLGHADANEDSVGTGIRISHGGATLRGMQVEITATVAKIEGRLVTFDLVANDSIEEISRGSHSRFVVDVEKLRAKVAAKAASLGETQAATP